MLSIKLFRKPVFLCNLFIFFTLSSSIQWVSFIVHSSRSRSLACLVSFSDFQTRVSASLGFSHSPPLLSKSPKKSKILQSKWCQHTLFKYQVIHNSPFAFMISFSSQFPGSRLAFFACGGIFLKHSCPGTGGGGGEGWGRGWHEVNTMNILCWQFCRSLVGNVSLRSIVHTVIKRA